MPVKGAHLSLNARQKISNSLKGKVPSNKGKKSSLETRKKLSDLAKKRAAEGRHGFKGRHHTEEAKQKMSLIHKGKATWNKGLRGQWTISEQHKRKISEANKGQVPPNKGLYHAEETRQKMSEAHKGRVVWNNGKPQSLETKQKISESVKKTHATKEVKQKMILSRKGGTPFKDKHHTEESKLKISKSSKGRHLSDETRKKMCGKHKLVWRIQTTPTKPEQRIIDVINSYNLQFKYTGLEPSNKEIRCKPDFTCINKKKIIEMFGRFYHTNSKHIPKIEEHDIRRMAHVEKVGWQYVIFWDDELQTMSDEKIYNKILEFYEKS